MPIKHIWFKPTVDSRYSDTEVVTHNGDNLQAVVVETAKEILKIVADTPRWPVVAIDEVQFFERDIVELARMLSLNRRVIVAGLDTDFRGLPFGPIGDILAICDEDIHLKAVCVRCGEPATRTQRFTNGRLSRRNEPVILLGGTNTYQARCRKCHELI